MKLIKLLTAFVSLVFVLSAQASQAVVLDFESLASSGTSFVNVADGYEEDGFKFLSLQMPGNFDAFGVWQTGSQVYPGSTALFNQYQDAVTQLAKIGGGAFDATSINLACLNLSPLPNTVTFVGTRADNSTVTNVITMGNPSVMTTYAFSGMSNIVKLEWAQTPPFNQFDNIVINPVPEPATLYVLGLGAVALLKRRRSREHFGLKNVH